MPTSTNSHGKQGQKYQNTFAFYHNKGSKLTKIILESPIRGLCSKCTAVIEWKKTYRKYKPLTTLKKCTKCEEKNIQDAYHIVCHKCATQFGICEKCIQPIDSQQSDIITQ